MALLDILTGQQSSSGRVPPLAMALAGLLTYSKLKKPSGEGAAPADGSSVAERLEDFFKPSPQRRSDRQGCHRCAADRRPDGSRAAVPRRRQG